MKKIAIRKRLPTVLTYAGVCGVVGTAVMAVKATSKALKIIECEKQAQRRDEEPKECVSDDLTKKDILALTWKCYIPSIMFGLSTIACIVSIHALDKRNQASLASAYAMLNEVYKQYRDAAKNVYGEDADSRIQAEIAKDTFVSADGIAVYSPDCDFSEKLLFYDLFSKRYFESTLAAVLNAEYHINRNLQLRGYSTINEFYEFLGLDGIKFGDEMGWGIDELVTNCGCLWLDFENHKTNMEDGLECFIISPIWEPNRFDADDL